MTDFKKLYVTEITKAWVSKTPDGKQFHYIEGYASDTSIDRDGDRMALTALKNMDEAIRSGMNLYLDHNHEVPNMIGYITKSEIRGNRLWIQARLQNPQKNAKVDDILDKMETGMKLGFSIGGDMGNYHMEEDYTLGKSVRVIDGVKLYEVSLVGLPSNENAFALGTVFKNFAFRKGGMEAGSSGAVPMAGAPGASQSYQEVSAPQMPGAGAPAPVAPGMQENGGDEVAQALPLLQQVLALLSQSQAEQSAEMGSGTETTQKTLETMKNQKGMSTILDNPSVRAQLITALKNWGQGDVKQDTDMEPAWNKPGTVPSGGEQPPAVTEPKPKDRVNQPDYPPDGDKTLANNVKKGVEMGGTQIPMPDPGTVPKKSEELSPSVEPSKPSSTSGSGTRFGAGSEVGSGRDVISGMGTGSSKGSTSLDKPSYSATDSPGGAASQAPSPAPTSSGIGKREEDEDEEAVKAFLAYQKARKAQKAKKEDDEGSRLFEEISARAKAEEDMETYLKNEEDRISGLRSKFDEFRGITRNEAGALPAPMGGSTGPTGAPKPAPTPSPAPAPSAIGATPSASMGAGVAPTGASQLSEEESEAFKALSGLFGSIVQKYAGTNPAASVAMRKEFDDAIKQVFQPKGGTDNFVNLRSPGQPPAKIAADPGRSGSSGVYRTDTGTSTGLDTTDDSKKNPPGTLDTAANEPIGTYQKPTELVSGTGYQMDVLRSTYPASIQRVHPTYKAFSDSEKSEKQPEEQRVLPLLKHFQSGQAPSKEELESLVKNQQIEKSLIQSVDAPSSNLGETDDSVILKGLKRINWTEK